MLNISAAEMSMLLVHAGHSKIHSIFKCVIYYKYINVTNEQHFSHVM